MVARDGDRQRRSLCRCKQALIDDQVSYWHSPAAMWFWLGLVAVGGCLIAIPLRNWFARGVRTPPPAPAPAAGVV